MDLRIGDVVKNCNGLRLEVISTNDTNFYPIVCKVLGSGQDYTFTHEGKYRMGHISKLDLQINEEGIIVFKEPAVADFSEETSVEELVENIKPSEETAVTALKVGDIVKNGQGSEFEVVELRSDTTYCIITEEVTSRIENTFKLSGQFHTDRASSFNLVINEDGSIKVFNIIDESTLTETLTEKQTSVIETAELTVEDLKVETTTAFDMFPPVAEEWLPVEEPLAEKPPSVTEAGSIGKNSDTTVSVEETDFEVDLKKLKIKASEEITQLIKNDTVLLTIVIKLRQLEKLLEV